MSSRLMNSWRPVAAHVCPVLDGHRLGVAGDEVLLRTPLGEVFALTPEGSPPPDLTVRVATGSETSGQLVWSVQNSIDVPELSSPQASDLGVPVRDFAGFLEGLVPADREPSQKAPRPVEDALAAVMPDLMRSALDRVQRARSGRLASVLLLADEIGIPRDQARDGVRAPCHARGNSCCGYLAAREPPGRAAPVGGPGRSGGRRHLRAGSPRGEVRISLTAERYDPEADRIRPHQRDAGVVAVRSGPEPHPPFAPRGRPEGRHGAGAG